MSVESNPVRPGLVSQVAALDRAVYAAIATTPTPDLDRFFGRLSSAADHSKLWFVTAAMLAGTGTNGRDAAVDGVVAIGAASAVVNLGVKQLLRRPRPDRAAGKVPLTRHVHMPGSTSFPSGHAASAFAFATGVAGILPGAALPVQTLATLVSYSRVHTGVHYPIDVVVGALIGRAVSPATSALMRSWRRSR